MSINLKRYEEVKFDYYYTENKNFNYLILIDDILDNWEVKKEKIETATVYIKIPSWYEIHEIFRLSTETDPYTQEKKVISEKIKNNKLKILLWKIVDHTGEVFYFNKESIDNLHPNLAGFFLKKINELISREGCSEGLTEEEEKDLSFECFKYYSAIKKRRAGKKVKVPTPPAVVILRRICEMFNCTPDVAKTISKRDIDEIFVSSEQEFYCDDPRNVGM